MQLKNILNTKPICIFYNKPIEKIYSTNCFNIVSVFAHDFRKYETYKHQAAFGFLGNYFICSLRVWESHQRVCRQDTPNYSRCLYIYSREWLNRNMWRKCQCPKTRGLRIQTVALSGISSSRVRAYWQQTHRFYIQLFSICINNWYILL